MKKFAGLKVMTPKFRMSFPALLKPSSVDGKDDPKYSVAMLFPEGEELKEMKKIAKQCAKDAFGKNQKGVKLPFRDQEEKEFEGYEPGCLFITASSEQKPGLVDEDLNDVIDPGEVYPGRWARATVTAFSWTFGNKKGVSFGLRNIQLLDHDDNLAGGASAQDDFADEDDEEEDDFLD
jgi:hypothetical protein